MSHLWVRIRFHEAGHIVVAWCRGQRPEVVGDIVITREKGRIVAKAKIHTNHIHPHHLSYVGLAGLLAEAKAAVEDKHRCPATFRGLTGLAFQIAGCVQQKHAGLTPAEEAWPINVDVAPKQTLTSSVLTDADLWFIAAREDFTEVLADLLGDTADLLAREDVWAAVAAVAGMIPKKEGAVVPAKAIRSLLDQFLPRKW